MTQPRVKVSDASRVCLSWFVTSVEGKKVYFHSGGDLGYRSFVGFEPESGAAVVLMGNNELFDGGRFGLAIFKAILSNTGLQLHPKNISFKLKEHILTEGIKKTKQVYYEEKNHHLSDYDFSASAVATLSEWLFDAGHKQEAIDVLIFCTELEPHASRWYQYIGDIYADMQNKQQAAEWYRKALQVDPSNEKIKEKLK